MQRARLCRTPVASIRTWAGSAPRPSRTERAAIRTARVQLAEARYQRTPYNGERVDEEVNGDARGLMPRPCTSVRNRGLIPRTVTLKLGGYFSNSCGGMSRDGWQGRIPLFADKLKEVAEIRMERRAVVCDNARPAGQCNQHEWPHHPASLIIYDQRIAGTSRRITYSCVLEVGVVRKAVEADTTVFLVLKDASLGRYLWC